MTYHATGRPAGRPSKQQEIRNWLQEYINSSSGGMRFATRVEIDGKQRGYNLIALRRAKKALRLESIRIGGLGSEGDWVWANPRLLSTDKSVPQELAEKLDRHEKRLAEASVTSKAQSRARIANGWLQQVTEELFDKGKTLAEIREAAAKQDPYLTDKNFADIEEEFQLTAISLLKELNEAEAKAEAAYEAVRKTQIQLLTDGKIGLGQVETEMQKAETVKAQVIEMAQQKVAALSQQIGPVMFQRLTKQA